VARGGRTVTSWIRAAKLSDQFRPCYTAVAAAGKKADSIAARQVIESVKPLVAGDERLTVALGDTPTPRHGPHLQEGPKQGRNYLLFNSRGTETRTRLLAVYAV
jgi:hypothetical protein